MSLETAETAITQTNVKAEPLPYDSDKTEAQFAAEQLQIAETAKIWLNVKTESDDYESELNNSIDSTIEIDNKPLTCACGALKLEGDTPGLCCCKTTGEETKTQQLQQPSQLSKESADKMWDRLEKQRLRQALLRSKETPEETEARLAKLRLRAAIRLGKETAEETKARLAKRRLLNAERETFLRSNETPEETEARLAKQRMQTAQRQAKRRSKETPEEKEARLTEQRLRNAKRQADYRSKKAAKKTEALLDKQRLQKSKRGAASSETVKETVERLVEPRLQTTQQIKETAEEIGAQSPKSRLRTYGRRSKESTKSDAQLSGKPFRFDPDEATVINNMPLLKLEGYTPGSCSARTAEKTAAQERESYPSGKRARSCLNIKEDPIDYDPESDPLIYLPIDNGSLPLKCACGALKLEGDTPGLCCSTGNISIQELQELPEL